MKADIHPNYKEVQVSCSCGSTFTTRSTMSKDSFHVEVCSLCHPFYTGKLKFIDTAGRIEKFQKKFAAGYASLTKKAKKPVKAGAGDEE